ncbi:MAG: bifunctional hydroxymethylpyrimidine kinase/phosphomethylpyrimidine kinase [Planctomycetota bacterium]
MSAHALTIAGSDPSGGAGIQADLKTFHAQGVYGMAVITSLTAQNTRGVTGIENVSPGFVREQLETLFDDCRVDAAKTGMLASPDIIDAVADAGGGHLAGKLVVDPVMVATSGDRLIEDAAVERLRARLFPLASVITPNREETEVLTGTDVRNLPDARRAAAMLRDTGVAAVLVKGIETEDEVTDLLVFEGGEEILAAPRLDVGPTHGSGCTFSAAIVAGLARGVGLVDAVTAAKDFVWRAIRDATAVGGGSVPLNHHVRRSEA